MNLRGIFLLSLLLGPMSAPAVHAAETLFSLYQKALEYDARYRSVLANTEAEREELNKARSLFFPKAQLSMNVGEGSTEPRGAGPGLATICA